MPQAPLEGMIDDSFLFIYRFLFAYSDSIKKTDNSGKDNSEGVAAEEMSVASPEKIPGLIAFWDFQEPAGNGIVSRGSYQDELKEMNGPIKRQMMEFLVLIVPISK